MQILCATDTTEPGRLAAYFADQLATRFDADLTFAEPGDVVAAAARSHADLIVVPASNRGPFAGFREARRHERLARAIERPVLVVPPLALLPASGVVAAAFGSRDDVESIAGTGAWLAALLRGRLTAVHVLPDRPRGIAPSGFEMYDAARRAAIAAEKIGGADLPFELHEESGSTTRVLDDVAAEVDADIVVVGTGHRLLASPKLRQGRRPVVVVPPGATPVTAATTLSAQATPPTAARG